MGSRHGPPIRPGHQPHISPHPCGGPRRPRGPCIPATKLTGWAFLLLCSVSLFLLRASPNAAMTVGFGGIHLALGGFRFFKERRWE